MLTFPMTSIRHEVTTFAGGASGQKDCPAGVRHRAKVGLGTVAALQRSGQRENTHPPSQFCDVRGARDSSTKRWPGDVGMHRANQCRRVHPSEMNGLTIPQPPRVALRCVDCRALGAPADAGNGFGLGDSPTLSCATRPTARAGCVKEEAVLASSLFPHYPRRGPPS
jgi:hypothetical protein